MISINGETWRIYLVSPNHPALKRPNGSITIGCCDDLLKAIFISDRVNETYFKKVLCHELVHAFMYSYKIDLGNYQEELLADLVATYGEDIIQLTNLIVKNKKREVY